VKLWYDKVSFEPRFGQLLSIWTVHVAAHDPTTLSSTNPYPFITIFPEVETSCHVKTLEGEEYAPVCRQPIGLNTEGRLLGLMTLRDFINGGSELAGSKVLLAIKSIGHRKRSASPHRKRWNVTNIPVIARKGTPSERPADILVVRVFDDTAETTLTLWNEQCNSCQSWVPLITILLLTDAFLKEPASPSPNAVTSPRPSLNGQTINLTPKTFIEIDPALPDAGWLRTHAQGKIKREHVNPPYSEGVFDLDEVRSAEERVLFRVRDIDEFVRNRPNETHVGWFSVVLFELGLVRLHSKGQLCCNEW
jgi:hypothetical protein